MATNQQKLIAAGSATLIAEPVLALMHTGGVGVIVGLAIGGAAYLLADDISASKASGEASGQEHTLPAAPQVSNKAASLGYRLLNGKSVRGETVSRQDSEQSGAPAIQWDGSDDDDDISLPAVSRSKKYILSDVLNKGFRPSLQQIFLGYLADGTPAYVQVEDLCHVALAGLTGNGKGNLMRLLMAQLCSIGVRVLLLNPHYMPYDRSGGEDWTPFIPHLVKHPEECASYDAIGKHLHWMTNTLLARRIERARKNQPIGKPFFAVIDELPAIVGKVKDAPGYIAELLREGRKYGIYLIIASQDFQVKTIGMDGGGVRKCLKTVFYVGGDYTTAKELLGTDEVGKVVSIKENELGVGAVMLRCRATRYGVPAQVPFVDNDSLYRLLGPSTLSEYTSADEEAPDDLQVTEDVSNSRDFSVSSRDTGNGRENSVETSTEALSDFGVDVSTERLQAVETPSRREIAGVSDDLLETIRRMKEAKFPDREIAGLIGLAGRKYVIYKQCLEILGYTKVEA